MLLPPVTEAEWPALHARPLPSWRPALEALRQRWGLGSGEWERLPGGEDSAVFACNSVVVKLVPPFEARFARSEAALLRRVELPIPTPRVLALEDLDGWVALGLSRLEGVPAWQVWGELGLPDRLRVLEGLGETLAAIWRTPASPEDGTAEAHFERFLARAARHGDLLAPEALRERLGPLPAPALVHLDLNDGNAMLRPRGSGWELAGVLDFVASRQLYPPIDLITPGLFFARGDRGLLRALTRGAGLAPDPERLAAWHLLHPFSDVARDLRMGGRGEAPGWEPLVSLWGA